MKRDVAFPAPPLEEDPVQIYKHLLEKSYSGSQLNIIRD